MKKFKYKVGDVFITLKSMFIVTPESGLIWNWFDEETLSDPEDEWIERKINEVDRIYCLVKGNYAFNLKDI